MLSEVLLAGDSKNKSSQVGVAGISLSLVFPCPYSIYKTYHGLDRSEPTPQEQWLMDDGKWQEEQTVMKLKSKGIIVNDRQQEVKVGEAKVLGHIDGTVTLNTKTRLFEHKAMSWERFQLVKQKRLEAFPGYKAQVNLYMLGVGLDECNFFCKHKDSCEPHDFIEPLDKMWTLQIVGWLDSVILEGWTPEPTMCQYCSYCGLNCFGRLLDFSGIAASSAPEMAEAWKKGKALHDLGEGVMEESREFFVGKKDKYGNVVSEGIMDGKDILFVEGLEIKKVIQHRFDISKARIIEEFGPEALLRVGEENDIVTYRFREVE